MCEKYLSLHSSLADSHGLDFQAYDMHHKIKVQCQASEYCTIGYRLTLGWADFSITHTGVANEPAPRNFPLPQWLFSHTHLKYELTLYRKARALGQKGITNNDLVT